MPDAQQYIIVSLPDKVFSDDDPIPSLTATIENNGTVVPYSIPSFKIGTLDALVQHADDLVKLSAGCETVMSKVADSLKTLLDGDENKIADQKMVNDKPVSHYLRTFNWNKIRYRADRPLGELIEMLQNEIQTVDNDVKAKFNQYNGVKTNLATLERKQNGNLSTKSLIPVVDPSVLVQNSEYLETHLIVVPKSSAKEFLKSYETLTEMVVPRSASKVAQDDEFVLFAATTFKKTSAEFLHKCRELKWTPRQFKYVEGGEREEKLELERVAKEEKKVWGESLRLGRTGWSESVMIWSHVMALRVFVETVLRYGLPLEFVSALILTTPKQGKKVKSNLDSAYHYLGGNAFGRDKKGRITKDDAALTSEMAAAGLNVSEGNEYTPYVYYEIEFP